MDSEHAKPSTPYRTRVGGAVESLAASMEEHCTVPGGATQPCSPALALGRGVGRRGLLRGVRGDELDFRRGGRLPLGRRWGLLDLDGKELVLVPGRDVLLMERPVRLARVEHGHDLFARDD